MVLDSIKFVVIDCGVFFLSYVVLVVVRDCLLVNVIDSFLKFWDINFKLI